MGFAAVGARRALSEVLATDRSFFRRSQAIDSSTDLDAGPHDVQLGHIACLETDVGLAQNALCQAEVLTGMME